MEEQLPLTVGKAPGNLLPTEKLSCSATNQSLVPRISCTQPLAVCSSQVINILDHKTPSQTNPYGKEVLQSLQKSEQFNNSQ